MKALFIGDVVGKPGRHCARSWIPELRDEFQIDLVIANGENSAGGLGATPDTLDELLDSGVHAVTMGNHTWRKKGMVEAIARYDMVVRPANYPESSPGVGSILLKLPTGIKVGLISVVGRVFMEPNRCPFIAARKEVERLKEITPLIIVDMHAEATSEKIAMGWYLDGSCTAVIGTHTHVQTADETILPKGTAYITDVGMTGPMNSVLGVKKDIIIEKFLTGIPARFEVAKKNPQLSGVIFEADDKTGRATSIKRIVRTGI